jgi:hypothetical protein
MGQFVGADPDQLDVLGQHMGTAAERLESIRQQIGFWLDSSPWDGSDAEDFRSDWHHRLQNLLHAAATVARDGAVSVARNAQQQRVASDMDGSGQAIGSGGGGWANLFGGAVAATGWGLEFGHQARSLVDLVSDYGGKDQEAFFTALRAGRSDIAAMSLKDGLTTAEGGVVKRLGEFVDGAKETGAAAGDLDAVGAVSGLADMVPVALTVYDLGKATMAFRPGGDASTAEKIRAGGDLAFDVLSMTTATIPPVSLAIDGTRIGFDFYMEHRQVINSAVHTAVVAPAMDLVKLDVKLEVGAAQAVGSVVSGGVHALRNLL